VRRRRTSRAGFTLVELLIATTLGGVLMTGVLAAYVFIGRNMARLASYQALENESRKATGYMTRDFAQAKSVKTGTTPTNTAVTLSLPSGDVTYTYDNSSHTLRRVATFGASRDISLLKTTSCECTTFNFRYYTTSDGAPTDQFSPTTNVPYSIKQIQVAYIVESPSTWSILTRTRYQAASARYLFRNRGASDGT
jgi:prepilin-type N-terminal cleavage/methylation domain-containing protein